MGACTGCNTVYGSTPPNNPHPYPWMNSLFQDGATLSWIFGESFIMDHARRSVIPERLADMLLKRSGEVISERDHFELTHLDDTLMTDREISELPKAWGVGGDGGFGDIGFQNVSKVVLQNRPNVKLDVKPGHLTTVKIGGFADTRRSAGDPSAVQNDPFGANAAPFGRSSFAEDPGGAQFQTRISVGKPKKIKKKD